MDYLCQSDPVMHTFLLQLGGVGRVWKVYRERG